MAALLLLFTSCPEPVPAPYEFKDQPLQGMIGGEAWTFVSGTAVDEGNNGELTIKLYAVSPGGTGSPWASDAYVDAGDYVQIIGVSESQGIVSFENVEYTVELWDDSAGEFIGCYYGAIDLQTIDAGGGQITGRIDARSVYDLSWTDNYINGNFTVAYDDDGAF